MAKVTSKLQVTVPKAIADRFGIRPGDEIEFMPGEDSPGSCSLQSPHQMSRIA